MFPIKRNIRIEDIPPANRWGAVRKFDIHTGVDLFCPDGETVYAFEDGEITAIVDFTGTKVDMPWWNDTQAVAIEGQSGVILYGEIIPNPLIKVGDKIPEGGVIGVVKTVLKKDKGRPTSMLHIELYEHGYRGDWDFWREKDKLPIGLKNIEGILFHPHIRKIEGDTWLLGIGNATKVGQFFGEKLTDGTWDIFEVHTENDLVHNGFVVIASTKKLPGVLQFEHIEE